MPYKHCLEFALNSNIGIPKELHSEKGSTDLTVSFHEMSNGDRLLSFRFKFRHSIQFEHVPPHLYTSLDSSINILLFLILLSGLIFIRLVKLPSISWTDTISMVTKGLQSVISNGCVIWNCLHDADLGCSDMIRKVFVVSTGTSKYQEDWVT